MDAFFISTGLVALAEMGDRTQLLAFLLAARYRKPLPIILAIFIATIANHAFAGLVGTWLTALMGPQTLRWVLGLSFIAMAIWVLIPDKLDNTETPVSRFGVFGATLVTFFIAEMGDKTQIATVALAAQYQNLVWVVLGTTLGMMIANVPAVYLGDKLAHKLPVRAIHLVAAAIFLVLGIATLLGAGGDFGLSGSG
ncbi:MAG: TMEM165/GDT1 family protein [Pseudohongiella sp.]|uniref:TMEM165/GDT1 family protein n=1 Tax=Pseudohongiella sp. TaxID=1979412 RepID=UPI0034A01C3B